MVEQLQPNDPDFNPLIDEDDDEEEGVFALPAMESFEEELGLPIPDFHPHGRLPVEPELDSRYDAGLGGNPLAVDPEEAWAVEAGWDEPAPVVEEVDSNPFVYEFDDIFKESESPEDLFATGEDVANPAYQEAWGGDEDDLDSFRGRVDDNAESDGGLRDFDLDQVLSAAIDMGASDIDLVPGEPVAFEHLGVMKRLPELGMINGDLTRALQFKIIRHVLGADFIEELELDTSYVMRRGPHKGRRFRLSLGKTESEIYFVFRVIANEAPDPDKLGVPETMQRWFASPNGLIIVCGSTGSGKSTTFAAQLERLRRTTGKKIITLEKPIEFAYAKNDGSPGFVVQREIGPDARAFDKALDSAMRQHPKIIMIGEVRNKVEADGVLYAADTGHLALTTLHATSPPVAISRMLSWYEGEDRRRVMDTLSSSLRGIANQTLVITPDKKSRRAYFSVLDMNRQVRAMIARGDTEGLQDYMVANKLTMEHALARGVKTGEILEEDALSVSTDPDLFFELMAGKAA